ncbi:M15 family metallopeptidase [Mahella australiensis]|uniref:Serine-type D-Ala-D-Ala carboxypeptidase n=1 Tax=Mahella australiensis (strain DSM 15567 / CIP 107919 / 50-1 BON) TaxID=697281 RepID=F3ZYL3_MAHA5|nr:M15 family metallopeptidase [Mahella australiensis]AEE97781.1 Serine-type D-Ala-D-Ala carboxypeptidase [Mahella australiensis 50-1 BON]
MQKKHKKRRSSCLNIILGLLLITIIIGAALINHQELIPDTPHDYDTTPETEMDEPGDIDLIPVSIDDIQDTRELWLVNGKYQIKENVPQMTVVSAYKKIPLSSSDIKMNAAALEHLQKMFSDAENDGINNLVVTSGYRTHEKQSELYKNADDKSYVQKPESSEHETGLAVDIQPVRHGMDISDNAREWLLDNAWEYGYILRYPEDKTDITGIAYEPWHFRYVGQPHATFIKNNNLVLEEYIDYLKNNKGYTITVDGSEYYVYRVTAKKDKIKVPKTVKYTVSSDNTGGYIITASLNAK